MTTTTVYPTGPPLLESIQNWMMDAEYGPLGFMLDTRDTIERQILPMEEETLRVKGTPEQLLEFLEALDTTIEAEQCALSYRVIRPDEDGMDNFSEISSIANDSSSKARLEQYDEGFFDFVSNMLKMMELEESEEPKDDTIVRVIMLTGETIKMDVLNHHLEDMTEQTNIRIRILSRRRYARPKPEKEEQEVAESKERESVTEVWQNSIRSTFAHCGCVAMDFEDQIHNALTGTVF